MQSLYNWTKTIPSNMLAKPSFHSPGNSWAGSLWAVCIHLDWLEESSVDQDVLVLMAPKFKACRLYWRWNSSRSSFLVYRTHQLWLFSCSCCVNIHTIGSFFYLNPLQNLYQLFSNSCQRVLFEKWCKSLPFPLLTVPSMLQRSPLDQLMVVVD